MGDGRRIGVERVAGGLGAEVTGVDLSQPLGDADFAALRRAFLEHLVLFFRDQRLTPEQLKAFTLRWGDFGSTPFVRTMDEHPEIIEVLKEADERRTANFGGSWHSDFSFQPEPPMATLLYALEVPRRGGDTLFANQYMAYERLSAGLRRLLDGLNAVHSARRPYGSRARPDRLYPNMTIRSSAEGDAEFAHPAVRVHPDTGRRALYVNPVYTIRFEDMTEKESQGLLAHLFAEATRPELTCRFRWRAGSLALWDNRCALHFAINDYEGERRRLHRTTVAGTRPVAG